MRELFAFLRRLFPHAFICFDFPVAMLSPVIPQQFGRVRRAFGAVSSAHGTGRTVFVAPPQQIRSGCLGCNGNFLAIIFRLRRRPIIARPSPSALDWYLKGFRFDDSRQIDFLIQPAREWWKIGR